MVTQMVEDVVKHWVGTVEWVGGKYDGYKEEIVVLAGSSDEAESLIVADVEDNYPEPEFAELTSVRPGRGTLDGER